MKTTTTLEELIRTQAANNDFDDIFSKERNQIILGGDVDSLLQQVAQYTPFIKKLTDIYIFGYYKLLSDGADKYFKQMFLNRFLNFEIGFQTVDLFRNKVSSLLAINDQYLSLLYDNFFKYGKGYSTSKTNQTSSTTSNQKTHNRDRNAHVDLPQDNINLDLENNLVSYANDTNFDNSSSETTNTSNNKNDSISEAERYDASVLEKLNNLYNQKLDEFENALFLKVW